MDLIRKSDFGPVNFFEIYNHVSIPILVHFSIVWISDFGPDFILTSSLDQNRNFELLKSGPKSDFRSKFIFSGPKKDPRVDSFDFQPSKMKVVLG